MSEDIGQEPELSLVAAELVTTLYHPRTLEMYSVTEPELRDIAAGASSIHMAFFGVCFGAAVTLAVTFVSVALSATFKAIFVASLIATGILSGYFAVRAVSDYRASRRRVDAVLRPARRI